MVRSRIRHGLRAAGLGLLLAAPALLVFPGRVRAQGERCDVPSHAGLVMTTLANEDRLLFFKNPVIRCPGGIRISADSARVYESTNYNQLWGNVLFRDEESQLRADQAQYFSDQRRLVATGNTVLTDLAEGSVIRGDNMTLIRAGPQRAEDFLSVGGRRPHATLYPSRQAAEEAPTTDTSGVLPADTGAAGAVPPDTVGGGTPPDTAAGAQLLPPDTAGPLRPPPDSAGVMRLPPDTAAPQPTVEPSQPVPSEPEEDRTPYEIDAQRFLLEGSRYFRAAGSVVVTRDSLRAVADSLEYDQDQGAILLDENATVTTAQTDLAAKSIRLAVPQDEVREALASGDAVLQGEDLTMLAPFITLFFTEGRVERLVAINDAVADSIFAEMDEAERETERLRRGAPPLPARELGFTEFPRRPYALAQDFILEGDSLEVMAPGEVLQEVKAVGGARGESAGRDSLNTEDTPALVSRDWLEGDTILALFRPTGDTISGAEAEDPEALPARPVARGDTATGSEYQLEQLVARGRARSMYRMAPSDSTVVAEEPGRLAIHYVVGDEITILLNAEGEAERMEVKGQTRGIHLEPIRGRGPVRDTIAAPDTSRVGGGATQPIPGLRPVTGGGVIKSRGGGGRDS